MPISPVISGSGLSAWRFLQATEENQRTVFESSADIARDVEYFRDNITEVETIDDLMSDRRLLKVALGAFGLQDEIDKGAFVRKVLVEGTESSTSFANRLANQDYIDMANQFVVGEDGSLSINLAQADTIVERYKTEEFEVAVGDVDNNMRVALNFERSVQDIAGQGLTEDGGWYKILASVPLRTAIEGMFNLPTSFSQLDLDQQVETLKERSNALFGDKTVEVFQDPEIVEKGINRYLLTQQLNDGPDPSTPGYSALTILSTGVGSSTILNLLLSNS